MSFRPVRRRVLDLIAAVIVSAALLVSGRASADEITIFAAASLKNAMDEITARFEEETGHTAAVSLGGSSLLARQIQQGAPADIYISANPDWMDVLERDGLIEAGTRFDLAGNSIVLIAHGRNVAPVDIAPGMDLAGMLGENRLAMALVDAVPAGIYGKAALKNLGIWEAVEPKVAQADNVRAALALVSTGEAPMGIVYATDAVVEADVTVVGTFPADTHPPIVYPVAAVAESGNPVNGVFLKYLRGTAARRALERQGFVTANDNLPWGG